MSKFFACASRSIFALALSLVLWLPFDCSATSYLLKPVSGNVSPNEGDVRTVDALTLAGMRLEGGDRVLLMCGGRYLGFKIRVFSTSNDPVYIGPQAKCAPGTLPVVDGRELANLRASDSLHPNRRETVVEAVVSQVFDGDRPLLRARYPASGYLILDGSSQGLWITLADLPGLKSKTLDGARLHARTQEWLLEEADLTGNGGAVSSEFRYPLRAKVGLFLTGKPWMLDRESGWVFDRATRTLTVIAGVNPQISIVRHQPLLLVEGQGSVVLDGIDFFAAGADAIRMQVDGAVQIRGVQVKWAAENGIWIGGARHAAVIDSRIESTGRDGIFFTGVRQADVLRNVVAGAGLYLAPGQSQGAINAHGAASAVIEGNLVNGAAYIGIRFAGSARVRGNLVRDTCKLLSDCGALYSWRRDAADFRGPSIVSGNAIVDVGVGADLSVKFGVNDWFAGVYLDEWTRAVTVTRNLVVNANQAVYLHNAFRNQVVDNLLLGSRVGALMDLVDKSLEAQLASRPPEEPNRTTGNVSLPPNQGWKLVDRELQRGSQISASAAVTGEKLAAIGLSSDWWRKSAQSTSGACRPVGPFNGLSDEPVAFGWLACSP